MTVKVSRVMQVPDSIITVNKNLPLRIPIHAGNSNATKLHKSEKY